MTLTDFTRRFALSAMLLVSALFAGCASSPNPSKRVVFPGDPPPEAPTRIAAATAMAPVPTSVAAAGPAVAPARGSDSFSRLRVGDLINVSFTDLPANVAILPQSMNIPATGVITLPYNVHVQAADKTTTELERDIRNAYVPSLFVNLTVTVKPAERAFIVDGEVRNPGRQQYIGEMTVLRAIGTAGGFTDFANRRKIQLRREGGQKFFINYWKALDDDKFDLPVYPNDHIVVRRSWF